MTHIGQGDRVPLFVVGKVLNLPEYLVLELVDSLGLPVMTWDNGYMFTSKSSLRELLSELAGTT